MGGMSGEIRGRSKGATYANYLEEVESLGDTFQEHHPDPKLKKDCKRLMVQDPDTGEWILHYHLHT